MSAERDTDEENWRIEVSQKLSEQRQKLADARQQLSKAQLRRQLVELRASRDGTVPTIAQVSVGSVVQTGEQLITLVPRRRAARSRSKHPRARRRLRA